MSKKQKQRKKGKGKSSGGGGGGVMRSMRGGFQSAVGARTGKRKRESSRFERVFMLVLLVAVAALMLLRMGS